MGRGARTESEVRSPRRPQVGSVAGRSLPGWATRRGRLLCGGPEAGASEATAVGAATAGERRWGRLAPSPGGGRGCSLRRSAPGVRPAGASVHGSSRRRGSPAGKEGGARRSAAANLPARSPGAREWSPRHDEPPGGNDEGPPATQNISPQPSGAGRALHEPPARSPPRGPAPRADSRRARGVCACVCAGARPGPEFCQTGGQVRAAHTLALPPRGAALCQTPRPPGGACAVEPVAAATQARAEV